MEQGVEKLIFVYIAVCAALIVFNFVCIFVFRLREKYIVKKGEELKADFLEGEEAGFISLEQLEFSGSALLALENTLDSLTEADPEKSETICRKLAELFRERITGEQIKDPILLAYCMYLSAKYGLFTGTEDRALSVSLMRLCCDEDFYLRKAALELLVSIGDTQLLLDAIRRMDREKVSFNEKLLHDGMLEFRGNREELSTGIWERFDEFSPGYQAMLLKYLRFSDGRFSKKVFALLCDRKRDREVHFASLRYLGRYPFECAGPVLYELAKPKKTRIWEYRAITASTLSAYPGKETDSVLRTLLTDKQWFVRFNAADSLLKLGDENGEFDRILDGDDRLAREALQYAIDRKKLAGKEKTK